MAHVRIGITVVLSLLIATGAEAQIGGLIRRKVEEKVKPQEAKAQEQPAEPEERVPSTPEVLAAFKRGLEREIQVREDYRKRLASLKTPAQYRECTTQAAMSPESMKIAEDYSARADKVTKPEEMQKLAEWLEAQMSPLLLKKCGEDPTPIMQQQYKVFKQATDAGAVEFAKGWSKPKPKDEPDDETCADGQLWLEDGSVPDAAGPRAGCSPRASSPIAPAVQQSPDSATDEQRLEYMVYKERVEKYCSLSKEQQAEARTNGIKVPGTGRDIYWVFPRGFAILVGEDCDHLMKLLSYLQ